MEGLWGCSTWYATHSLQHFYCLFLTVVNIYHATTQEHRTPSGRKDINYYGTLT